MKLGLRIPDLKGMSLEEKVDLAVECKLDAIELSAAELKDHSSLHSLKNYASKNNITITSAGIGIDLCNPNAREQIRKDMKVILEGAKILGGIPLFSRTMVADEGVSQNETWRNVTEFTREITEMCHRENITFSIEIDHAPCFVDRLERFEKLYRLVNHVNLHLNFDPTNLLVNGSDPFESIEKWGHLYTGGHIKDGVFRTDKRSEVPLGEGEVEYLKIFKALEDKGIELTFHFEHLETADEVKKAASYMHGLLSQ